MALRDLENQEYANLTLQNLTNGVYDDELVEIRKANVPAFFTVYGIIVVAGIIGNMLNVVLFSCKRYHHLSYSVFMRALSVTDSLVLIINLCEDIDQNFFDQILSTYKILCPFNLFFSYFGKLMSAYLLVAISVDRYVAVVDPLRRATVCTFRRSVWILVAGCTTITGICLGISIWEIVHLTSLTYDYMYICPMIDSYQSFYVMGIVLLLGFVIMLPFIIVVWLNAHVFIAIKSSFTQKKTNRSTAVKTKTTVSLILATFLSVALNLPLALVEVLETFADLELGFLFGLTNLIAMLNYSMNFYVFIIHSKEYRKKIKHILREFFIQTSVTNTMTNTPRPCDNSAGQNNSLSTISMSL